MDEDPGFENGDIVEVDTVYFGVPDEEVEYLEGIIIGKVDPGNVSRSNVQWIVDFGDFDFYKEVWGERSAYKYQSCLISSYGIVKLESDLIKNE